MADANTVTSSDADVAAPADAATDTAETSSSDGTADGDSEDASSVVVQFLQGTSTTTSPDGSIPYEGPTPVLAKRTVDATNGTILEESWHGGEYRKNLATLRPGTLIFDVSDEGKTYEGTLTFATEDWVYGSVTYDIAMATGNGTITGTGVWDNGTYTTDKMYSENGAAVAKIVESLGTITEDAFLAAIPN